MPNISQSSLIACNPIHRYETAIPREAKFPEDLRYANPWNSNVPTPTITATPSWPYVPPAAEPIARSTIVA